MTHTGPRHRADAGALRGRPYVCDECIDANGAPVVHTPDAPYDTPASGVHYSPATGAWLAWRTDANGRVNVVRESGAPRIGASPFGRTRDVDAFDAFAPLACADCRAALAHIVGRAVGTQYATCAHVRAAAARTVRAWYYGPYDGVRPSRAFLARYNAHDARADIERARARDASDPSYVPHTCPRERRERTPDALPYDGVDTRRTCTRQHATPEQARACAAWYARVNAPLDARRAAERRAVLRERRARSVAFDARADAPYGVHI